MTNTPVQSPAGDTANPGNPDSELPRPRRGAHWRWSTPRRALVAGGALATLFGVLTPMAGAASSSTNPPGVGPTGGTQGPRPTAGVDRPTVGGKIIALSGSDITVQTRDKRSTTVVYTSGTQFKVLTGGTATATASASALKVGEFIGVQGTKRSDGSVTASTVVVSGAFPPGPSSG